MQRRLGTHPEFLASLEINLSSTLQFEKSLLLLTTHSLISLTERGVSQEFPYCAHLQLTQNDHAGVGTLTLANEVTRLTHWRYTLSVDAAASAFIKSFASNT